MKKLRLLTTLFVATAIGFAGCSGKNDAEKELETGGEIITPGGKTCTITKVEEEGENDYDTYEYDNSGRIIKTNSFEEGKLEWWSTITYTTSKITVKHFEQGSTDPEDETIYTVSNGRVTGMTETYIDTDSENNTSTSIYTESYEHNSEGYLTKSTSNETYTDQNGTPQTYTSVTNYTYQGGNLVKEVEKETSGNSTDTYTTTYEYDLNIANTLILDDYFLISKPNKNAVKKKTEINTYEEGESNTYVMNYSYIVNNDKLITKRTTVETFSDQSYTDVDIYSYNCK